MHNSAYLVHTIYRQYMLSNIRIDYLMFQLTNIYSELYYKFKKWLLNYLTLTISIFLFFWDFYASFITDKHRRYLHHKMDVRCSGNP